MEIKNVLSTVSDFLHEAQNLGVIKEFTLVQCEDQDINEKAAVDNLLSTFLEKMHSASVSLKDNNCSDSEYIDVTKVEEKSAKIAIENSDDNERSLIQISDTKESSKVGGSSIETNSNVQIHVDTSEMKRRISAFISRKRKEVDEWNVQEFCGRSYMDEETLLLMQPNSCARVDAVFVPRRGSKSHIKLSRVRNVCGPQSETKKIKQEEVGDQPLQGIEERIDDIECHLKLKTDSSLRYNIFLRLKALEDRILFLESLSPEYIHMVNSDYSSPCKKANVDKEKIYINSSSDELKKRFQLLKESCKAKLPQITSEPSL